MRRAGCTFEAIDGYGVSTLHRTVRHALRRLSEREIVLGRAKVKYKGKTIVFEKNKAGKLIIPDSISKIIGDSK